MNGLLPLGNVGMRRHDLLLCVCTFAAPPPCHYIVHGLLTMFYNELMQSKDHWRGTAEWLNGERNSWMGKQHAAKDINPGPTDAAGESYRFSVRRTFSWSPCPDHIVGSNRKCNQELSGWGGGLDVRAPFNGQLHFQSSSVLGIYDNCLPQMSGQRQAFHAILCLLNSFEDQTNRPLELMCVCNWYTICQ